MRLINIKQLILFNLTQTSKSFDVLKSKIQFLKNKWLEMFLAQFKKKQIWILSAILALIIFAIFESVRLQLRQIRPSQAPFVAAKLVEIPHEPTFAERLKKILKCHDRELDFKILQHGNFWVVQNLIVGTKSNNIGCAETITYTTIGDYTFMDNLPMVIERWQAPISFALFTPGYDIERTMESIQYARNCLPEKVLISEYVSFHLYFPAAHMPKSIPRSRDEALLWNYNCSAPKPYLNISRNEMYRTVSNLTYPINVGRNIARRAVNTYFIFASDLELIPSPNVPKLFLEMVERNTSLIRGNNGLRVFTLPVFEIESNATVPKTKKELKAMLSAKTAVQFHEKLCRTCHLVPDQKEWINTNETENLNITAVGRREGKFVLWEPFYISDNREPIFDERITWEGQSNKRIQNFAMCLMGYEYLVIHPSFLVHSPGIKKVDLKSPRLKFVPATNRLIHYKIEPEYRILYGNNFKCRT